jgi:hypothetical protein
MADYAEPLFFPCYLQERRESFAILNLELRRSPRVKQV